MPTPDDNQYGPDAYRRLQLVKKQFKKNQAEQKKKQARERWRLRADRVRRNRALILRFGVYAILAAVVVAVLVVVIRNH